MSDKLSIRPSLDPILLAGELSPLEYFQNKTLRPILKLQHDLIIAMTNQYLAKKKNVFYDLEFLKKEQYLTEQLLGDKQIRLELNGIIIGMMTPEEYAFYSTNSSELKKRIKAMMLQRIFSDMDSLTILN